jgi:uncharacterized protein (UPF0335 family)
MPANAPRADDLDASSQRPTAGRDVLERLRDRVERAAAEIERLREENVRLAERVRELAEDDTLRAEDAPAIRLPEVAGDPSALREQIQGFIEALDRVLAERDAIEQPPADT